MHVCLSSCTFSSPTEKRMDRERMSDPEVAIGTSVCVCRMGLCGNPRVGLMVCFPMAHSHEFWGLGPDGWMSALATLLLATRSVPRWFAVLSSVAQGSWKNCVRC